MKKLKGPSKNTIYTQKNIQDLILPVLRKEGIRYKKNKNIFARRAHKGEQIITITKDGKETKNEVKDNSSFVVKNQTQAQESYIVLGDNFHQRYTLLRPVNDTFDEYKSKGEVIGIKLTKKRWSAFGFPNESSYFIAPWGEPMIFKKYDYLVSPLDFTEVYRVARKEFWETYIET